MGKAAPLRYVRMFFELLAMLGMIILVVIYAQTAGLQPAPEINAGVDGFVARYGMGTVLTGLFLIAGSIIGFMMMLSRFPKLYRYPVKINAANVEIQYILAKIMLSGIQIVCAAYFSLLMIGVYKAQISLGAPEFRQLTVFAAAAAAVIWLAYFFAARANK